MASSILAGFVKGFANREMDMIDERRKQEAKLKEAELLARLQSETKRADFLFEEGWKRENAPDKSMSTIDPKTGRVTVKSASGKTLAERQMTESEIEDFGFESKQKKLTLENLQSQIADRARDSARQDRVAAAQIGAYGRRGLDGSDTATPAAGGTGARVAKELRDRYKDTINKLLEQNPNVSPLDIDRMGLQYVNDPRVRGRVTGRDLEQGYLDGLNSLFRTE